jgi:VCBS repeat-containing protein
MTRKSRKIVIDGTVDFLADPVPAFDTIGHPPASASRAIVIAGLDPGNSAAIIGGDITGSVTEGDGVQRTSGKLTIIDVPGEDSFEPVSLFGRNGIFTLKASGEWTYESVGDLQTISNGIHPDTFTFYTKDFTKGSVTVNVIGVNDDPVLHNPGETLLIYEDEPVNGTVKASDPDNDWLSLRVATGPSHGTVTVWGENYTYTPDRDYVGKDSFEISVNDGHGGSVLYGVGVTTMPVNDGPLAESKTFAIEQGDSYTIKLDDFGFADTRDAQWGSGNALKLVEIARFNGPGELWFDGAPIVNRDVLVADIAAGKLVWKSDAGGKGQLEIGFYLRDDGEHGGRDNNRSEQGTLTIRLVDTNDAPVFTLGADQVVNEDAGSVVVANMATGISAGAASEAGQTLTFTLTNDNGALFAEQPTLSADGTLRYRLADNAHGVATVSVTLKDDGGTQGGGVDMSGPLTFTITAHAINDAPRFTAGANQAVDEDSGQHTVAGWATGISAGPADESVQTLAFSVSNDNNALFKVQPSIGLDGTLTYELAADANGMATVSVTLTDGGSGDGANSNASVPITFTIAAAPMNDAPVVAVSPTYTVSETIVGATLGKVLASDVEGDPIGYELSINTGDDKNPVWVPTDLFVIVGDELRLAAGKSLDYETTTSFSLKIVATETAGLAPKSVTAFTTIRVNDVNENPAPVNQAPTVTSPNADAQIEAGQTISLTIGDAHFSDPEGTDLTYSITVDGAALPSWMTFDTTSGAFTGKPASAEAGNYVITVTASDGALTTSDMFNLLVTSPAAPEATILLSGDAVAENSARGTVVGALSGTDADGDAFVSFALGANPGKVFRIADGALVVRDNAKLDFETKPAYEITVIAGDADGATVEKAFTITLKDVAEDPVGTKGNDRLFGDALDNIINGRRGNDRLTGGDGADTFVFGKGFGKDAILDFDPTEGDVIDLSRMVGVESFEDLVADHAAQSKTHVRISADDGSVLMIQNFDLADLKADMFLF